MKLIEELRYFSQCGKTEIVRNLCVSAADEIDRLRGYFEYDATCPCCMGITECEEGCTFSEDAPEDHEKMFFAREALMMPDVELRGINVGERAD